MERTGTGGRQWRGRRCWRRRSIAQAAVWSDGVIVTPQCLDQHLCLAEAVEDLAVEQLVAKRTVQALVVTVVPRRARGNVQCLHADLPKPFLDRGSNGLAAIVRSDMRWRIGMTRQIGSTP
jgi:hypothetical protein